MRYLAFILAFLGVFSGSLMAADESTTVSAQLYVYEDMSIDAVSTVDFGMFSLETVKSGTLGSKSVDIVVHYDANATAGDITFVVNSGNNSFNLSYTPLGGSELDIPVSISQGLASNTTDGEGNNQTTLPLTLSPQNVSDLAVDAKGNTFQGSFVVEVSYN